MCGRALDVDFSDLDPDAADEAAVESEDGSLTIATAGLLNDDGKQIYSQQDVGTPPS